MRVLTLSSDTKMPDHKYTPARQEVERVAVKRPLQYRPLLVLKKRETKKNINKINQGISVQFDNHTEKKN